MAYLFYQTTPGSSCPSAAAALRFIKDKLVLNGFSVPKSADGTTYNSSGDQITTDSGAGALATTGAWMVVRAPASAYELLIQVGTTTNARVLQSVAGFSGGSPGAARCPTATDQQFCNGIGGGTDASPTYSQLFATDNTYRVYMAIGDSSEGYDWWAATIPTGGGTPTTILTPWSMAAGSYPSSDTDPRSYLVDYASGGVAITSRLSSIAASGGSPQARSGSTWKQCCPMGGTFGSWTAASAAGLHAVTSEDLPVPMGASILVAPGPYFGGPKGVPRMPRWCLSAAASRVNGHHLTDGGGVPWVRIGDLWLRGDATVPSLT